MYSMLKMVKLIVFYSLVMFVGVSSGLINNLSFIEYDKMPPKYFMDPYERCINQPGGVYCSVHMTLVSDKPSPLLEMIMDYSASKNKHFNYTNSYRGVCITQNCKNFYKNETVDLRDTLEACFNKSLWNDYMLKVKLSDDFSCYSSKRNINIETADIAVAIVFSMIVFVNLVGSLYEIYFTTERSEGIKFLICFSLRRNWKKLVAPHAEGSDDERLQRFIGFTGFKTMSTIAVIMFHSLLISAIYVENPRFIEKTYDELIYYVLYNGNLIVQMFFLISAFMLTFNLQIYSEKNKFLPIVIPKGIIIRFLRLTPAYASVLAFTCTWLRFTGSGPLWEQSVGVEARDCRRYWWIHMLYFNNNVQISECMMQTWYLAADFQMHCIALIVTYACQSNLSRKVILSILLMAGILIPAIQTYIHDLDGTLLIIPEHANVFTKDAVLNTVYRSTHTNFACYVIGLGLGYLVYRWQNNVIDISKYKKYRFLYWAIIPAGLGLMMSGSVFYIDGPRAPILIRAAYAGLAKPMLGFLATCVILGMIFKFENLYRGLVEWRGWTTAGRLSYCAYLVHFVFIRYITGIQTSTIHVTVLLVVQTCLGVVVFSYISACGLWLLVEAPFGQVLKMLLQPKESTDKKMSGQ